MKTRSNSLQKCPQVFSHSEFPNAFLMHRRVLAEKASQKKNSLVFFKFIFRSTPRESRPRIEIAALFHIYTHDSTHTLRTYTLTLVSFSSRARKVSRFACIGIRL